MKISINLYEISVLSKASLTFRFCSLTFVPLSLEGECKGEGEIKTILDILTSPY